DVVLDVYDALRTGSGVPSRQEFAQTGS
ncbi:hypothetical protein MGSAQ_002688, partial [marine sediment metagenome]